MQELQISQLANSYDMNLSQMMPMSDLFDGPPSTIQVNKKVGKKSKKSKKKHKYASLLENQPKSAYSCSTHQNQFLRLYHSVIKNRPICKSCGIKLGGQKGYLACCKVNGCLTLCSACKVCPHSHPLRNIISLKKYQGDPLYAENKFKCHSCKEVQQLNQDGVWHCGPCNFSICDTCKKKTDELWQINEDKNEDYE